MGWLRLVGSLKFQVSSAKYSLFYRALLKKRPVILRSLLIVATPYLYLCVSSDLLKPMCRVTHSCACVCVGVLACVCAGECVYA